MIIFLYGEDSFRSGLKLKALREKFLISHPWASGLTVFDFSEKGRKEKILSEMVSFSLFSSKRLLIVKNLCQKGSKEEQEEILKYLKKNRSHLEAERNLVVVFFEEGVLPKNHPLSSFLLSGSGEAKKQEFKKLQGKKLEQWILVRARELGLKQSFSQKALEKLVIFCGSETRILENEIRKLINFCEGRIIQEQDVAALVKASLESNIFAIVDAVGARQKKQALSLLHQSLQLGSDPFYLFSMLVYQFRNMLRVSDFRENFGYPESEIIRHSKLHPFVVKKCLSQTKTLSFEKLAKLYQVLGKLDAKMKTGKIKPELALDMFIGGI